MIVCLKFVHKLDSISDNSFDIPTYVANLAPKKPAINTLDSIAWHKGNSGNTTLTVKQKNSDSLGIYNMFRNVVEWTLSGSDPLFIVTGDSFSDEMDKINADYREFDHGKVKAATIVCIFPNHTIRQQSYKY